MAGTPDPVLGSDVLTFGVAAVVGAAVAAAIPLLARRRRPQSRLPTRWLVAGGLAYALGALAVWAGVRAVAEPSTFGAYSPGGFLAFVALATAVLALQAALPAYLYARWHLLAPVVGLFAGTTLALYLFLRVGGETDVLWLYALLFGPAVLGATLVAGLLEVGGRRLRDGWTA